MFLGDSITAGLGVAEEDAFPAVTARRLRERGHPIRLVNAGVSGDTTAGGRERLPWLLRQRPDVIVVELGANDALRGQPLETIEENLREIVRLAREAGALVLLLSMRIPPSYGPEYTSGFTAVYERIAREANVSLVPHFLDGVGGRPSMNQPDGIHPTHAGHERLADNIEEPLTRLVARGSARRPRRP